MLIFEDYCHLQVCAVLLYLLNSVETISLVFYIIYNTNDATSIWNFIFCVEKVYCISDFGVWEGGSKYNDNTEQYSGFNGLEKLAIEPIVGFNFSCDHVFFEDLSDHNDSK
jgi:phosphorylase kinase alpha/beta subunit